MKTIILTVFLMVSMTTSLYAKINHKAHNKTLSNAKMHFVHLKTNDVKVRSDIAKHIHMDQIIEDSIYSVVNDHDLSQLKKNFSKYIVETHVYSEITPGTLGEEIEFPKGDEKFHTYKEAVQALDDLAKNFPHITERFSLGTSLEGKDIPGIKLTSIRSKNPNLFTPAILFLGAHHAREHLSTEIPLLLAKHLAENYDKNPEIKKLLDSREIYIAPMVNPDGAMYDIKGKKYKSWRKNRANNNNGSMGVDLNRNYGYGWGTGGSSRSPRSDVYMGPKPFSEPETLAVKSFVDSKPNIRILLTYHTFSELILYPWGGKNEGVGGQDQKIFEKMATTMAKWNHYKPEQASDLYIASGDTCDWAYGVHNIYCFTFELSPKSMWSGGFYPGAKVIDRTFQVNINPALYLMKHAGNPSGALTEQ